MLNTHFIWALFRSATISLIHYISSLTSLPLTFINAVVFGLNGNWFGVNDLSAPITICSQGFLGICTYFLGIYAENIWHNIRSIGEDSHISAKMLIGVCTYRHNTWPYSMSLSTFKRERLSSRPDQIWAGWDGISAVPLRIGRSRLRPLREMRSK